jgi:hypothetical protein
LILATGRDSQTNAGSDGVNKREAPMNIQVVEKLSLHEQFRLVEIAHETGDYEIKKAALTILATYLNPPVIVAGADGQSSPDK